ATNFDLVLRFFAGAIEHRPDVRRVMRRRLQEQRGFADARLTTEQHERTRHQSAAEHAIELAHARRHTLGHDRVDVRIHVRAAATERGTPRGLRTRGHCGLFDDRFPRAAIRTAPEPLRRLRAALRAAVDGFGLLHLNFKLETSNFKLMCASGSSYPRRSSPGL